MTQGCILITGASGLLGQALMEELRQHADLPVVGVSSHDADLTHFEPTRLLFDRLKPRVVYHLAARVAGIMGNLRSQGRAYLDNIRMNTNVVEAARLAGARKVVAMGSTAIYSDMAKLPMSEDEIWVGPPHPAEAGYAHAKRAMLAQLDAYRDEYDLDYAYCVSTNLYGPHDKFDEQHGHVIPSLLSKFQRAAREGTAIEVWGSGTPRRDFLYSKDAAYAMRLIGERFTGPINMATGSTVSIAEAVETIRDVTGFTGEIRWDRTKPDGQKLRAYDVGRLASIGFRPRHSFAQGIHETYAWLSENAATARR